MKRSSLFTILLCFVFALAGCATHSSLSSVGGKVEPGNREQLGYPINAQSSLVMITPFIWWPGWLEQSGYSLPAGIYTAESEDTNGVFFKAPHGFKMTYVTSTADVVDIPTETATKGGIYLPKAGTVGVRGHVYLWIPIFGGWKPYRLPDTFFSAYGKTWKLTQSNQPPNTY